MTQTDFDHLLATVDALSPDQMRQLHRELESRLATTAKRPARRSKTTTEAKPKRGAAKPAMPMTREEFHRHLMEIGLISQLPDPAEDIDDDDPEDEPVVIEGEPLSETIIRERR
jgi:hypothetical protein